MRHRHGLRYHALYGTWSNMMSRCYNPNVPSYRDYGARGITVWAPWRNPERFITDIEFLIGPRPAGMSLDRIDNDGNYAPENVRWATRAAQLRNSRRHIDGDRRGALYVSWWRLMHRCPEQVHAPWHDWAAFRDYVTQALPPRQLGLRLDRTDDSRPYEPGNLTWITGAEQVRRAQAARWRK